MRLGLGLDPSRAPVTLRELLEANERYPHRAHQLTGAEALVRDDDPARGRTVPRAFALLDEVGAGKTKQVVDAAQVLYLAPKLSDVPRITPIDTILVLTPGFARSTWADEDPLLGEVAKHAWTSVPNVVHEFHGDYTDLDLSADALHWIVSNYEFIRRDERRDELLALLRGRSTWMTVDESWCIKGNSDQTRACIMIRRKRAERATILSGTPLSDGKPLDLYYQFAFLDPAIIDVKNITHFKSRYCVFGGFAGKQVVDYKELDDLNRRVAPYVLSRRTRDCFDLPPMLDPITINAPLTEGTTWKAYREMRDEMVVWLGSQTTMAKQGIVKALRLAQITSGFLGGLETLDDLDGDAPVSSGSTEPTRQPIPAWLRRAQGLPFDDQPVPAGPFAAVQAPVINPATAKVTRELGREKLDALLRWLASLPTVPDQLLVWCRFRPELERTTTALRALFPTVENLKGGQSKDDRDAAKRLLAPGSRVRGAVVGNPKAGGASLNFSAANVAVYLSNGPALIERTQSIGRIERPGATQAMLIVDVVATGPKGQKTIDHHILRSLKAKQDMATWTVDQWRRILAEE